MIKVYPLNDTSLLSFSKLFKAYYTELDCDEDTAHLLDEYILPDIKAGLVRAELLDDGGETCGFILYQTDGIDNEWCKKEGWGDIREIYIAPDRRRNGLGKFLLYTAEMKLKESGVLKAYALPAEGSEKFFTACGYKDSGETDCELDCPVYVKENLINGCGVHTK